MSVQIYVAVKKEDGLSPIQYKGKTIMLPKGFELLTLAWAFDAETITLDEWEKRKKENESKN